ncbi:MAG: M12 family metallo-peptidase [Bacteroidota bacterium]
MAVFLFFSSLTFGQNQQTPLMAKIENAKSKQSFQQANVFTYQGNMDVLMPQAKTALSKGQILELKTESLSALLNAQHAAITFNIPLANNQQMVMDLILRETLTEEFVVTTSSSNGQPVNFKRGLHYQGVVRGAERSLVAISIFEGEVIGVISTLEDGDMVLGKTKQAKDQYIFYKENDLLIEHGFQCGADSPEITKVDLKRLKDGLSTHANKNLSNCVQVYLECEHDMYLENGSVQATVDYMTGLFNVVATLYDNEQITTQISEIFVWDTPDNYPTNSTSNALTAFRNARQGFNGDLAHLISRGAPAGGGVAWVDALCSTYNFAYSYVNSTYQLFPTYSWSVEVVTHEMGHNLGSPHTHACAWNGNNTAIDGCGPAAGYSEGCNAAVPPEGTIMSYCHLVGGVGINFNLGFGPQPGDLIRNRVTNASCLSSCGGCTLTVAMSGTPATSGNNGTATATPSGGTSPYSYAWSNGGSSGTISGLAPGTYSCTVTDNEGCFATGSYEVEDQTPCTDNGVTLTLNLDNYPGETTWEITDGGGAVLASGGPYSTAGATVIEDACLGDGCYDFTIYDSYGDGICCGYGTGSYSLTEDASGSVLASGGAFGSSETTNFCVPTGGGGGCTYTVINSNGFESGWGIWNDGGSDCRRSANDSQYASNGTYCVRLRDNTSTSTMTTDNLNLAAYDELLVEFGYYPRSMDNSNEDFWLQISTNGGSSYTTVEEWNRGDEFENNNFYTDAVTIAGPFTSSTRLRFRCDASGNSDWVYIDDVTISGCTSGGGNMVIGTNGAGNNETSYTSDVLTAPGEMKLFPNPASNELTVAYDVATDVDVQIHILDFTGRVLQTVNAVGGANQERMMIADLRPGYYLVQLITGEERISKKLVVAR